MLKLIDRVGNKIIAILGILVVVCTIAVTSVQAAPSNGSAYAVGYSYPSGTYHYCALRVNATFRNGSLSTIDSHSYVSDLMLTSKDTPYINTATQVVGGYSGIGSSMITYGGRIEVNF